MFKKLISILKIKEYKKINNKNRKNTIIDFAIFRIN